MKAERAASVARKEANEEMREYFKDKRRKLEAGCEKCSGPAAVEIDPQISFVTGEDGQIYASQNIWTIIEIHTWIINCSLF